MRVVDNRDMHNICVQDVVCANVASGGLALRELPFSGLLKGPAFSRLRGRARVVIDEAINREAPEGRGANVIITRLDGSTVSQRVDAPRGHSKRGRVNCDELRPKWPSGLPDCDVDTMIALSQSLKELDDVQELANAVRSPD